MIALALLLATVTGNPPPASYTCNGSTTVFSIPFPYIATSQVVATQTSGTGVTTTVIGTVKPSIAPTSGTLTLSVPCPSGAKLTISRSVPLTQPQSFRTGSYSGAAHEQAFDRLEMQIQQNAATHTTDKTAQAAKDAAQDLSISGVNNAVAALNSSSQAVTSASSVLAFGSTTPRTLTVRFSDTVNVKDFGAKGDGTTDDAAAIQNAVNAAQLSGADVFVPAGNYRILTPIVPSASPTPAKTLRLRGANWETTSIFAGGTMAAVFNLPAAQCDSFEFRDITIDAQGVAGYAVFAPQLSHSLFFRADLRGATTAGLGLSYGWANEVAESRVWLNTGDGIQFQYNLVGGVNGNNALRITKSKIYSNNGVGIRLWDGYSVQIEGNIIETNRMGGIYAFYSNRGLVIRDNYFESNAQDGLVFTTPAKTVKADIILNGGDGTLNRLGVSTPTNAATIEGNLTFSGYVGSFVYASGVTGLRIVGNYAYTPVPLLGFTPNKAYAALSGVVVEANANFSTIYGPDGFAPYVQADLSDVFQASPVSRTNLFPQSIYDLVVTLSSGGGTIVRSANQFLGWEGLDNTGVASCSAWGVILDLATHPELAGNTMAFSAMVKASVGTTAGHLYSDANPGSTYDVDQASYTEGDTNWHQHNMVVQWPSATFAGDGTTTAFTVPFAYVNASDLVAVAVSPTGVVTTLTTPADYTVSGTTTSPGSTFTAVIAPASGYTLKLDRKTVKFGIRKANTGLSTDVASFSKVVLLPVGTPYAQVVAPPKPQWYATAAPTTGTWARGDVVWNSAPVAAGVPGWQAVAAGTPGTWKAMAALAP